MIKPRRYVTDVIGNDFENWTEGDIIFINAGTGVGKSHFIKTVLYEHCKKHNKKILLLSNRNNLKSQNEIELKDDTGIITCENYQKIEFQNKSDFYETLGVYIDITKYDYVISDECQYFFTDSTYNNYTDISLHNILNNKSSAKIPIKIFMTATPRLIKSYFENNNISIKEYEVEKDYSYINKVVFYYCQNLIEEVVLDNLEDDEKVLYFCKSAERSYTLHKKYESKSSFICSSYNAEYRPFINHEELNNILTEEKFYSQILFTTLCLDNGVNIKDSSIKKVIIDCDDVDTLIQCLGRYRLIDINDTIDVYIRAKGNQAMGGILSTNEKLLKMADELTELGDIDFIKKYPREDYGKIIYDSPNVDGGYNKVVNEVMRTKCKERVAFARVCIDCGKNGFCDYIIPYLQKEEYTILDEEYKAKTIEDYIEELVGKRLLKEDREKLVDRIDLRIDGHKRVSLSCMNKALECLNLPYVIITESARIEGKSQRYWKITKPHN